MTRVALYSRVSDQGQRDNTSLDAQLRACREFALAQGWTIVREVREVMSGAFVLARPEFNGLLELANQGKVDVIVVDIPDRFGRGDAVAKLEMLADMSGAKIAYAKKRFDDTTMEGFVQKSTDALVSGIERFKIAERTADGKRNRAREGRVIASSFRPYGYKIVSEYDERGRKVSCILEIVPDEAEVVCQMFDWFVHDGVSAYAIADRLTKAGVLTLTDKDGRKRAKKLLGKCQWNRSTVNKMLRNETFDGRWVYGKRKHKRHDGARVTTTSEKRDEDDPDRIVVPVPPILEPGVFELAQERIAENKRRGAFKPTKYKYLLRSIVFCARCSSRMTGWTRQEGQLGYYWCRRNYPHLYEQRCHCKMLRQDRAERIVWDYVCEAMQDEERLFHQIAQEREEAQQAQRVLIASIAALDAQDEKDRQRLDRLLDLYSDGGITKAVFLQKKRKVETDVENRDFERTDLQARLSASGVLSEDDEQELREFRERIVRGLDSADFDDKRRLLEMLAVKCVWDSDKSELTVSGILSPDGKILSISSLSGVQYLTFARVFKVPQSRPEPKRDLDAVHQGEPGDEKDNADNGKGEFLLLGHSKADCTAIAQSMQIGKGG